MADEQDELNKLMMALGSVVVIWGMVEDITRMFLRDLVFDREGDNTIQHIVLSETPFRTQLDILKKAAHVRRPNTDWFNRLAEQVNELAGRMHAERNRLIHDLWEKNEEGLILKHVRGKEETAVAKKSGEWQLKITGERAVPVGEVEAFFEKASDAVEAMMALKAEYVEWRTSRIADTAWANEMRQLIQHAAKGSEGNAAPLTVLLGRPKGASEQD